MKIIVIEHDGVACDTLVDQLSTLPRVSAVQSAQTAEDAEALLATFAADLVFLDLQLPDKNAFEVVDRIWPARIPVIICTTTFDRRLVHGLQFHRVEHLIRPFGREEVLYTITRGQRPDPVDPADNFARLLALGKALGILSRREIFAFRKGETTSLDIEDIGAIHCLRERYLLWSTRGIWETNGSGVQRILHSGRTERLYRNGIFQKETGLSLRETSRARRWLRRLACLDFILNRPCALQSVMAGGPAHGHDLTALP